MSNIFTTTVRLNLDKEDDRRAYEYLRHMDKAQHRSYSKAIVAAVNDFFFRQEKAQSDPLWELEERLLERIEQTVRRCLQENPLLGIVPLLQGLAALPEPVDNFTEQAEKKPSEAPDLSAAFDFINSL